MVGHKVADFLNALATVASISREQEQSGKIIFTHVAAQKPFHAGSHNLVRHAPAISTMSIPEKEIERRMNAGIRQALNTPPLRVRNLIGKTERAQSQRQS